MVKFEILHFFLINNQGNPSKQKGPTGESGYKTQPSITKMVQIQQRAKTEKKNHNQQKQKLRQNQCFGR